MIRNNKGEVSEMQENVTMLQCKYMQKLHYINLWHDKGILFFKVLIWRQQFYVRKTYVLSRAQFGVCVWEGF